MRYGKHDTHPYDFLRRPSTVNSGRGCAMKRLTILTVIVHKTAPAMKYATPAERVYKAEHAVRAGMTLFVYIYEIHE